MISASHNPSEFNGIKIFSGDGYSGEWPVEAARRGLHNNPAAPSAFACLLDEKNVQLFSEMGVLSPVETRARYTVKVEAYTKMVNIEALTMIVMATRDYIPAVEAYVTTLADVAIKKKSVIANVPCRVETELIRRLSDLNDKAFVAAEVLKAIETRAASIADAKERAECYCNEVIPAMDTLRAAIDEMETLTASKYWPVPTYGDMMFRV
jgi:glutamine synthetase